ncbi:sulfite exporter TauE/SafE family protein [Georgenia sp. Z1344]|uniref:sulfite exporter TauE/SafE family protein n=1 Tax=Georgenia sp. Z1344 TaxID=3416706 RepID=UPI003CE9A53F
MEAIALATAIGAVVGVVVGTLGAGGGVLTVPALVYLLGMGPHAAATASLVIVGVTSLVTLVPHARRGNVRLRGGLVFGAVGAVASAGGAWLAHLVDGPALMAAFSVLLLGVAVLMARRASADRRDAREAELRALADAGDNESEMPDDDATTGAPQDLPQADRAPAGRRWRGALRLIGLAAVVGLLTGLFGVGGGFAAVPALVLALGYPMRAAVGTSLLVITINSAAGLLARVPQGIDLDVPVVLAFALASTLAGQLGARLSTRTPPATLTTVFAVLLVVVSVLTASQALPDLFAG